MSESAGGHVVIRNVHVDDSAVWRFLSRVVSAEQMIDQYYRELGIRPFRIFYEQIYDTRRELFSRVIYHIDSGRDWGSLSDTSGSTRKLSGESEADNEMRFVQRYRPEIAYLYAERDSVPEGWFAELTSTKSARQE